MKGMIGGGMLKLKQLLLTIGVIFTLYTAVLIIMLYLLGNSNVIYSVSLIFSSVTGGGFIPVSTALSVENSPQLLVLMAGMIISALPFAFHYALLSKEMKTTKFRPEVFLYFGIILVSVPIFYLLLGSNDGSQSSNWLTSAFHVVSASTNTGFQYIDFSLLSIEGKSLLIILMLIGGTAFSAAGGIKVGRIMQIFQRLTKKKIPLDNAIRGISSVSSRYNESYVIYGEKTNELRAKKAFRESL